MSRSAAIRRILMAIVLAQGLCSSGVPAQMRAFSALGGGGPSSRPAPPPPPTTPVMPPTYNPFDMNGALRDLQDYYERQSQRANELFEQQQEEEDRRYEEEAQERRRVAEIDQRAAQREAERREQEARWAAEESARRAELQRVEVERLRVEDAELAREEDQRAFERARRYLEQARLELGNSILARTAVADLDETVAWLRSETRQATSQEGITDHILDQLNERLVERGVPGTREVLGGAVSSIVEDILSEDAPASTSPDETTIGSWLADPARESLTQRAMRLVQDIANRAMGIKPCNIEDDEATQACDDVMRAVNPINALRGIDRYKRDLLDRGLGFFDIALPGRTSE